MVSFDIEACLEAWAHRYGLQWQSEDKDGHTLRMTDVVDDAGNGYGVRIGPPAMDGNIEIEYWRKSLDLEPRRRIRCALETLEERLEGVYSEIEDWIEAEGERRSLPRGLQAGLDAG